ncbi:FdtA/QdtA family cupin domain-containing protein [Prauserella oleivorans]|uniref:FdtA/QdtA family cupin domain-containing protein n=1 Tax=Prauserella oleivorans TaxID=1478153 RepID=A0ABW5W8K5_9PSEU
MTAQPTDLRPGPGRIKPCRMIELAEHADPRGSLSVVEAGKDIDFEVQRVYYLYNLPMATVRGAHGHRTLQQLVIAVHGQFEITVDDGFRTERYLLDHPRRGLFIGPMTWRNLVNFSPGAVGLVLASEHYDEADYYRDYAEFLRSARAGA